MLRNLIDDLEGLFILVVLPVLLGMATSAVFIHFNQDTKPTADDVYLVCPIIEEI